MVKQVVEREDKNILCALKFTSTNFYHESCNVVTTCQLRVFKQAWKPKGVDLYKDVRFKFKLE